MEKKKKKKKRMSEDLDKKHGHLDSLFVLVEWKPCVGLSWDGVLKCYIRNRCLTISWIARSFNGTSSIGQARECGDESWVYLFMDNEA